MMLPISKIRTTILGARNRGFTLIELLVVIAILAILLVIVLVAVNPAKQTRDARNTQRRADVLTILNSVNQYFIENGEFPDGQVTNEYATCPATSVIGTDVKDIAAGSVGQGSGVVPSFVADLPLDPNGGTAANTGYTICQSAGDRVTVAAPGTEGGIATVSATR